MGGLETHLIIIIILVSRVKHFRIYAIKYRYLGVFKLIKCHCTKGHNPLPYWFLPQPLVISLLHFNKNTCRLLPLALLFFAPFCAVFFWSILDMLCLYCHNIDISSVYTQRQRLLLHSTENPVRTGPRASWGKKTSWTSLELQGGQGLLLSIRCFNNV